MTKAMIVTVCLLMTTACVSADKGKPELPFNDLIIEKAAKHNISPSFVHRVIRVESNYNPRATGRAGEIGLMQIKLQTARGMGYRGTRQQLYDPATNIRYGVRYLAEAKRRADGDRCKAAMLYNQGIYARSFSRGAKNYCNLVNQG